MKKIVFILSFLVFQAVCGNHHYLMEINANYTWGGGNADFVKVKIIYHFNGQSNTYDSLILRGPVQTLFRRSFAIVPDSFSFQIVDHSKRIPQQHTFVRAAELQHCKRLTFSKLMKNAPCESFYYHELGMICASMNLSVFDDSLSGLPELSGIQQPDMYCKSEAEKFKLTAPCFMSFRPKGGMLQWYESETIQGPWTKIDTGWFCLPYFRLNQNQLRRFNLQRYYKLISDSFTITGEKQKSTTAIGPFFYYIQDSIANIDVFGQNCGESEKRIQISLVYDSTRQHPAGVNVWLRDLSVSDASGLWYFGNSKNLSQISLSRNLGQYHKLASHNSGKTFNLTNGTYAVGIDYTPWNDFDCGFQWDTVIVKGPYGFSVNPRIICGESCPGRKDGKWTFTVKKALWNDSIVLQIPGFRNYKPGDTISGLKWGNYAYTVAGTGGCHYSGGFRIDGAPAFGRKMGIDTILCAGQQIRIDAKDSNAIHFEVLKPDGGSILNDTFLADKEGLWILKWNNVSGCEERDTVKIVKRSLLVKHDFLIPAQIKLNDTAWAIDHSIPKPQLNSWNVNGVAWKKIRTESMQFYPSDTGWYPVMLVSQYDSGCVFRRTKYLHVVNAADTVSFMPLLGYNGPLIQKYLLMPNPSNGNQYKAEIALREAAELTIVLLDPVSGNVLRKKQLGRIQKYADCPFDIETEGVYFLRLLVGSEIQTRKILIIR
jgi:hypothetical protein